MAQIAEPAAPVGGPDQLGGGPAGEAIVGRSPGELLWRRFRKDRAAMISLVFLIVLALMAFVGAPLISKYVAHHGPGDQFIRETINEFGVVHQGPSGRFWFGADTGGRDLFVRVLYGARTSLIIALIATGLEVLIGVTLGLIAGFYRGKTDTFISRLGEVVLSMPILLLALGLVAACGLSKEGCLGGLIKPGLLLVSYVIGLFSWPYIARIVRGQVLSLREKEFVEASRSLGASNRRIMFREILPNLLAPIIVYATLIIPTNILFEAALSFLGIGVPEEIPSWGAMLEQASETYTFAWWTMFFPGMFLLGTTLAFNLLGDGLRDAYDPRMAD
ncbi:MAG: ABC transporter permease [Actinomycetota bacterium]